MSNTDIQKDSLVQMLAQIEKNIEEENGRIKRNRMPARYFMFFFLIGGEEESKILLERKVKELLSNPDACAFLQISEKADIDYGQMIEETLKNAANNHVEVDDLNYVFLCPIVFSGNSLGAGVNTILRDIDSFIDKVGIMSVWQPVIIINKSAAEYKKIYFAVNEMTDFISQMSDEKVNRCCLLSNLDENGFAIPSENIMQMVAMTVVLQNVATNDDDVCRTVKSRVGRSNNVGGDDSALFFTVKNVAVTNPKRSLVLQRISSAIDYFSTMSDKDNVLSKIRYSFISDIMSEYVSKLPHHGNRITLFPLFGIMEDRELHAKLEKMIREKYYEPIYGDKVRREQTEKAKLMFLQSFFAANGSLLTLKDHITNKTLEQEINSHQNSCGIGKEIEIPYLDNKKLACFKNSEYERAAATCATFINTCGGKLLETVGKQISDPDMIRNIEDTQDSIEKVKECIERRLRQLKNIETVLVVGQTEQYTRFDDVQYSWVKSMLEGNTDEYSELSRKFNGLIYLLLTNRDVECGKILEDCYDAIKSSIESNDAFMEAVDKECRTNEIRGDEFVAVIKRSGRYPLRFHGAQLQEAICIIGDSRNALCRKLSEKLDGTMYDFKNFDRVGVLHISGVFSPENIMEWQQIKAAAEGER